MAKKKSTKKSAKKPATMKVARKKPAKRAAAKSTAKKSSPRKKSAAKKTPAKKKSTAKKSATKKAKSPKRSTAKATPKKKPAARSRKKSSTLGRPRIPGDAKLELVFQNDYEARQIFAFLKIETVRELEQFGPDEIIQLLKAPLVKTVGRIRKILAVANRSLSGDTSFALEFRRLHVPDEA